MSNQQTDRNLINNYCRGSKTNESLTTSGLKLRHAMERPASPGGEQRPHGRSGGSLAVFVEPAGPYEDDLLSQHYDTRHTGYGVGG